MQTYSWILCLTTSLVFAAIAEAQPGGVAGGRGRPGGFVRSGTGMGVVGIAGTEAVQKELELSAEATAKVKAITEEFNAAVQEAMTSQRQKFRNSPDATAAAGAAKMVQTIKATSDQFVLKLKEVLTAEQFTRLQQINWQSMGIAALSDPEVIQAIPISTEQQEKIKTINTEYAAKRTTSLTGAGASGDRPEPSSFAKMQEQNIALNKEHEAKIMELLTNAQQEKFASLKGTEFDLSQLRAFGGGGSGNLGLIPAAVRNRPGQGSIYGFGVGVGVVGIAGNEAVQKELGLDAEAAVKVKAVSDEFDTGIREPMRSWRAGVGKFADMTQVERNAEMKKIAEATEEKYLPKLKELLTADQFARLQQISWQDLGVAALSDAEVIKAISISSEQQEKIKSLNTEYAAKRNEAVPRGGAGGVTIDAMTFAKIQQQNSAYDNERVARITEVLTKDQQQNFAALKGKEFDLSQLRPFGGGGPSAGRPFQPRPKAE